jgi:DNA-binding MarR family transcriptional regulator
MVRNVGTYLRLSTIETVHSIHGVAHPGASDVWTLLLQLVGDERRRLPAIAAELGLSEAQGQVLRLLDPQAPVAMCRIAEALDCDPSNVTGIVDRLEARGLVERRADARDRRVRRLVLTAQGREQRKHLVDRLHEAPSEIEALSMAEREGLCAILKRALACRGEADSRRKPRP